MCLEVGGLHWGVESMMQADSFEAVRRGYTDLQEASGVSGFLCLGRLFQGQPNEAALCI